MICEPSAVRGRPLTSMHVPHLFWKRAAAPVLSAVWSGIEHSVDKTIDEWRHLSACVRADIRHLNIVVIMDATCPPLTFHVERLNNSSWLL